MSIIDKINMKHQPVIGSNPQMQQIKQLSQKLESLESEK